MRKSTPRLTVADVGESGLLARLERELVRRRERGVLVHVGDDAAVLTRLSPSAVLSTDLLIEGVDFDFAWGAWADVGHKAAAANLSDLAAMGARPRGLLLGLGLRPEHQVANVLALVASMAKVGRRFAAPLVGGDLSRTSGPLVVAVTVVGEAEPRRAFRRRRARVGDVILVSGALGGAAVGLALLSARKRLPAAVIRRQLRPEPQIALGLALARWGRVTSAADISDGLARDALHLAPRGCGVELDAEALPIAAATRRAAAALGLDVVERALSGGEDFERVVAMRERDVAAALRIAERAGTSLTPVGRVVSRSGLSISGRSSRMAPRGFDHFRSR